MWFRLFVCFKSFVCNCLGVSCIVYVIRVSCLLCCGLLLFACLLASVPFLFVCSSFVLAVCLAVVLICCCCCVDLLMCCCFCCVCFIVCFFVNAFG